MLLVEFTLSELKRLSTTGVAIDHYWDSEIIAIDAVSFRITQPYGGYVKAGFGGIGFSHDLFIDDWPPPVNGAISLYYTDSDSPNEDTKELLFTGTAHRSQITRKKVSYRLYGPSYTATVVKATVYNDSLVNVMTTLTGGGLLNLGIDTTAARVASPNVTHTTKGDILAIDLASRICAFYSHLFYISDGTLYLVDMLADNGSRTITEFDYFPSTYNYTAPVSGARAKIDDDNNFIRYSDFPYGNELNITSYHTTEANINTALDDILTITHSPKAALKMPLLGDMPLPGERISWNDTSLGQDTNAYIRARSIQYDFMKEKVSIDGEGDVAAA